MQHSYERTLSRHANGIDTYLHVAVAIAVAVAVAVAVAADNVADGVTRHDRPFIATARWTQQAIQKRSAGPPAEYVVAGGHRRPSIVTLVVGDPAVYRGRILSTGSGGDGRDRFFVKRGDAVGRGLVIWKNVPRASSGLPPLYPGPGPGVLVHHAVHHETKQEDAGHGDELGTRLEVLLTGIVDGRAELLLPATGGQLAGQLRERQALRERQLVQRFRQTVHANATPGLVHA